MHFSWSSTRLLTLSALYSDQMLILLDFPNVLVFRMCRVIQWPNVAERISAMRTQNPTVKIYKQQPWGSNVDKPKKPSKNIANHLNVAL